MTKKINLTTVGNFISVVKLQQIWQIDDLLHKVNINYDELLYLLTILSDIYSKNGKWLEILGCGIVNPVVLENCNIDPEQYSGLAFGLGIERIAMLKYGVNDIRDFYKSNLDFLSQFK